MILYLCLYIVLIPFQYFISKHYAKIKSNKIGTNTLLVYYDDLQRPLR